MSSRGRPGSWGEQANPAATAAALDQIKASLSPAAQAKVQALVDAYKAQATQTSQANLQAVENAARELGAACQASTQSP